MIKLSKKCRISKRNMNIAGKISIILLLYLVFISNSTAQSLGIDAVKFTNKDQKTFTDGVLSDAVGITKESIYKQKVLAEDIIKLSRFYFDNGFFDVKVDTAVAYNDDDQTVVGRFLIKENKRYRVSNLIYYGLGKIPAELRKSVDSVQVIKKNDFYNKAFIIQQNNLIVDKLQNNGYMNAKLRDDSGTVIVKHDTSASVVINFERADTINKFGKTKIAIDKNVYGVDEALFTKVITYKEGDIYSK